MTIKTLAYSAQQHLEANTGARYKRAHIYELLAAAFGFNSYASLCADAVFIEEFDGDIRRALHIGILAGDGKAAFLIDIDIV